ncbi:MAG: phytanoyl-CoA dioxygenase family protein [Nitrospira sp.]|nr:phytanoyl-CoA dioxygenase family protein [Nitrospira sp.]
MSHLEETTVRNVAVEIGPSGAIDGVLGVFLSGLETRASVRCYIDGAEVFSGESRGSRFSLVLHGHLLEPGSHELVIQVAAQSQPPTPVLRHQIQVRDRATSTMLNGKIRQSLIRNRVPVVTAGPCDSSLYNYGDRDLQPWFDKPDAMESISKLRPGIGVTPEEEACLRNFVAKGFAVLPFRIDDRLIDSANLAIDEAINQKYQGYEYGTSQRLEHMHIGWPAIKEIFLHKGISDFLTLLFGAPSEPCQSLVFVFGSQQDAHQDTIHLTPFPAGYMCGVWIPLEDVREGSGELTVYPGSHRFPRLYMSGVGCPKVENGNWTQFHDHVVLEWARMLRESKIDPVRYRPKKGEILVWHENLMHAGSQRTNPALSRRSIVTHHFARGSICYYDSSGMPGHKFSNLAPS